MALYSLPHVDDGSRISNLKRHKVLQHFGCLADLFLDTGFQTLKGVATILYRPHRQIKAASFCLHPRCSRQRHEKRGIGIFPEVGVRSIVSQHQLQG